MTRTILATIALLTSVSTACAAPPSDEVMEKVTSAIRKHCPDASIQTTKEAFVAKFGTMTYTLHARGKGGEVYERTYQEEGPNWKGFVLTISLREGNYEGAAAIPQTMSGPYFATFIDATNLERDRKHHFVTFAYGSRLDPELKKAIMDAIPKNQFQKGQ